MTELPHPILTTNNAEFVIPQPPRKILNKKQFYERWLALQLGNRPRCFESIPELLAKGTGIEKVSIRSKTPGGRCLYNVEVREIEAYCASHGVSDYDVVYQENLPDEILVMQGNVGLDSQGGVFFSFIARE